MTIKDLKKIEALEKQIQIQRNKISEELDKYNVNEGRVYTSTGREIIIYKKDNIELAIDASYCEYGDPQDIEIYINDEFKETIQIQSDDRYPRFILELLLNNGEFFEEINADNYWNGTIGTWEEISQIPDEFLLEAGNPSSCYYLNKDKTEVVRVSNHWGSGIGVNNWYLNGYFKRNSYNWKDECGDKIVRIGKIKISDLIDIR